MEGHVTVTITTLMGDESQVRQPQTSTVRDLKQHIVDEALYPGCDSIFVQRLLLGGAALEDDASLCSLPDPISLTLVVIPWVQCTLMAEFLVSAIQSGDVTYIKEVLATPIHPDNAIRAADGAPVICLAALSGRPCVVDLLLAARANVERAMPNGQTAAQIALQQGHAESLRCLLTARANVSMACLPPPPGHSEVLQVLISARADTDKEVRQMDFVPMSACVIDGNHSHMLCTDSSTDVSRLGPGPLCEVVPTGHEQNLDLQTQPQQVNLDLHKCASFNVSGSRFGVKLSWDATETKSLVDLDLQAVVFDSEGKLVDAVYYNNLFALDGTLEHSGDELTEATESVWETVWVDLVALQRYVQLVVFVVARAGGGYICDALNGSVTLHRDSTCAEVARFDLKACQESVFLLGVLIRGVDGSWLFRPIREQVPDGQHFMDVLEPAIGGVVRQVITTAPKKIKASFAMRKGTIVDLPRSLDHQLVVAGLGWDTDAGHVDLDVSVVLFTADGSHIDTIIYDNMEAPGIIHAGDNLTGDGHGDDESISLQLDALQSQVQQLVFVINIYTKERTFHQVTNPYCRLCATDDNELCKYELKEAGDKEGLIMARLMYEAGRGRWSFQAAGLPCRGRTWKESMSEVMEYAKSAAEKKTGREVKGTSVSLRKLILPCKRLKTWHCE